MIRLLAVAVTGAALALAACGDDDDEAPADPPAAATTSEQADGDEPGDKASGDAASGDKPGTPEKRDRPGVGITTADSQFGEVLFDSDQRAIYLFDKETGDESECYGACAKAWPPVLTKGEPQAKGPVKGKLLGTTERRDGTTQVTYDGRPLYYYVDEPAGQVLCHNVDEFGGLWLALRASGEAVS